MRAPTSTSSPAAAGWRANPIPADRPRWGRFDELQERNYEVLRTRPRGGGERAATRRPGRSATTTPACMDEAAIERSGADAARARPRRTSPRSTASSELPALLAELHTIGVNAFFSLRRRSRLQGRVDRDRRSPTRAASACPTATTTSETMRARSTSARQYVDARRQAADARRRCRGAGGGRGGDRDAGRNRARQGGARQRVAPRSRRRSITS